MNNTKIIPHQAVPTVQRFYVWYITGAFGEDLEDITRELQVHQDAMVVEALSEQHAVQWAQELLEARYEFEFVITKVMNRAEFLSGIALLDRVDRGEVPVATLADRDYLVWAERYVYGTNESGTADDNP